MLVFSVQGHDLRKFKDKIRPELGTYAEDPKVLAAQAKLSSDYLHTDQVVWCSLNKPEVIPLEAPQFLHTIEFDMEDVVAILNGFIWEHLIGNRYIPTEIRAEQRFRCRISTNPCKDELLKAMEDAYISKHLPEKPWEHVITNDLHCMMPVILLRWPFSQSRIVSVEKL